MTDTDISILRGAIDAFVAIYGANANTAAATAALDARDTAALGTAFTVLGAAIPGNAPGAFDIGRNRLAGLG